MKTFITLIFIECVYHQACYFYTMCVYTVCGKSFLSLWVSGWWNLVCVSSGVQTFRLVLLSWPDTGTWSDNDLITHKARAHILLTTPLTLSWSTLHSLEHDLIPRCVPLTLSVWCFHVSQWLRDLKAQLQEQLIRNNNAIFLSWFLAASSWCLAVWSCLCSPPSRIIWTSLTIAYSYWWEQNTFLPSGKVAHYHTKSS